MMWMRFSKDENVCTMFFMTSLEAEEPFKTISFLRREHKNPRLNPSIQYSGLLLISKEKKGLNPVFHDY